MQDYKWELMDKFDSEISALEKEFRESSEDLRLSRARLVVEKKSRDMQDADNLREDFEYSVQAIESIIAMDQNRNEELKNGLEMAKYRRAVLETQFRDNLDIAFF